MGNILDQIVAHKRTEIEAARAAMPLEELRRIAENSEKPRNFFSAVTRDPHPVHVIAEIKRASPSAGLIRPDFDPVAIARSYHENGASAISCLTDRKYFQGDLAYLKQIKAAVPLPVLRKDFLIDPYQLYESRAHGADAVLLIAECLSESQLIDLMILASELQLTTLVEVHEMESLLRVRPHIGFPHRSYSLLGINNRDLKTMTTDLNHTLRLMEVVDDPRVLVSESGIRTHQDLMKLHRGGVRCVLVGEHLMKEPDPGQALARLLRGD